MYRLARDLGVWDVPALGRAMSAPQLGEWEAFYRVEADLQNEAYERVRLKVEAERGLGR